MALSPTDNAALVTAGKNFTGFFATLAFQTFFYGIYVVLFFSAIIVHCRKPMMNIASKIMFIIIIGMFISTTCYYAVSTAAMVAQMKAILIDQDFNDVVPRLRVLGDLKVPYNVTENWMSAINFCASDAVVVWRAWALAAGNRKIVIPSIVLLFLTLLSSGIFAGYSCVTGNPATSPILWSTIWAADQLAMESLSLLTNISATMVISWKAWKHRQLSRASTKYQSQSQSYGAENILLLLVESGLVYILIQATLVILTYLFRFSPNDPVAANVIRSALGGYFGTFIILSAIYPTMVVFIVALQRSMSESRMWSSSNMAPSHLSGATALLPQQLGSTTSTTMTDNMTQEKYGLGTNTTLPAYQSYPFIANANPTTVLVRLSPQEKQPQKHVQETSVDMERNVGWEMVTPETRKIGRDVEAEATGGVVRSATTTTTTSTSTSTNNNGGNNNATSPTNPVSAGLIRPLPTTPATSTTTQQTGDYHTRKSSLPSSVHSSNSRGHMSPFSKKSSQTKF